MSDTILAQLAALKTAPVADLKARWRELFDAEPPPYNRRFLESRLSYRIQELAYGGLKQETVERLEALGEEYSGSGERKTRAQPRDQLIEGTRLVREYRGVEHTVTVLRNGYEYEGRPYKTLSPIARAITGTSWNGRAFFGLKDKR